MAKKKAKAEKPKHMKPAPPSAGSIDRRPAHKQVGKQETAKM